MLIFDLETIGNKLYEIRKKSGMTQAEVAEAAGLSDRTYADIERGTANMRISTMLQICKVFHITPNDILTENDSESACSEEDLLRKLSLLNSQDKEIALALLSVYLKSVK